MAQQCSICYEQYPPSDFLVLYCNHEFCKQCLVNDWTTNINNNRIDDNFIKCPKISCQTPIKIDILQANLEKTIFDKYEHLKSEQYIPVLPDEIKLSCPKCNSFLLIHKASQYFNCPTCKNQLCANPHCFGLWREHKNLSCKQYKNLKHDNKGHYSDTEFEKLVQEKKWRKCPVCSAIIEKTNNCNYITCESIKCQKKNTFCYLCGMILKGNERNSHYMKNNAYNSCEKIRQEIKTQNELQEFKEITVCPMCGDKSNENIKVLVETNNKIWKCSSSRCNLKFFCHVCKKQINDSDIKNHVKFNCNELKRISSLGNFSN